VQEQLNRIEARCERIETLIVGDGADIEGLAPRVKNLERDKARAIKIIGLAATAFGFLGSWLKDWILGRSHP